MKKNENGRSMVEMLGVLAIIGVLSVAGIAGYTMAMRKYRANEIAQAVSMTAMLARSARGGQGIHDANGNGVTYQTLSGQNDPTGVAAAGPITANVDASGDFDNTISLQLTDNALCLAVENIFGTTANSALYVDPNTAADHCGNAGVALTVTVHP